MAVLALVHKFLFYSIFTCLFQPLKEKLVIFRDFIRVLLYVKHILLIHSLIAPPLPINVTSIFMSCKHIPFYLSVQNVGTTHERKHTFVFLRSA